MSSSLLIALLVVLAVRLAACALAFARRSSVRASGTPPAARPLARPLAELPEQPAPPEASEPADERETRPAVPRALVPVAPAAPQAIDPIAIAARDMAKSAYEIAQHLGFDAMPDRARPSLRKLRIPLRNELEQRAAAWLAGGAHPCVHRIDVARDQRSAITLVDLAVAPPS